MTPEGENAVRSQCRKCVAEIRQVMKARPKPKWNIVVPPILDKHYQKIAAIGIDKLGFISKIGRMQGRYGVES
ncbi:hypothetical protein M8320_09210 [Leclercia sp. H6W5]|uniref:hypothetical protein n=1 Tax=Leclercia tamurae TaxID=2926467 RepID=UPI0021CECAFC|nr:hypothetical protein [Leclercia tamurae]MCU6682180.1 hypothetical protein [Leclercia tamurae]